MPEVMPDEHMVLISPTIRNLVGWFYQGLPNPIKYDDDTIAYLETCKPNVSREPDVDWDTLRKSGRKNWSKLCAIAGWDVDKSGRWFADSKTLLPEIIGFIEKWHRTDLNHIEQKIIVPIETIKDITYEIDQCSDALEKLLKEANNRLQ